MKKSLFLLFASFSFVAANAQIKNDKGTFTKPTANEVAIETQTTINLNGGGWFQLTNGPLSLLSSSVNSSLQSAVGDENELNLPGLTGASLKLRKFQSDKKAHRVTANLSIGNNAINNLDDEDGDKLSSTAIGFAVSYGQERHFSGAERLSTYIGWDATLGIYNASAKATLGSQTDKISQSAFGIGAAAVTGMDYYILPKVYLGVELSYGVQFGSLGVIKTSDINGKQKQSSLTLTPNMGAQFRLGYRF